MDYKSIFDLSGKVAVITGGGSGLGRSIALGLAQNGAKAVIVDINAAGAEKVLGEVRAAGGVGHWIRLDVTKSAEVEDAVREILSVFGKIDILVNCAGITRRMPGEVFDESDWDAVLNINLKGTFLCCREIGRHMLEKGSGSIINITSLGAHVAITNSVAYCASKGGVAQLTKTLAVEWAARGVRVNAISPGVFETPILRQCVEQDPEYGNRMLQKIPFDRFGNPDELVGPAVFLASGAASMVTGHILAVDGGYLAQ